MWFERRRTARDHIFAKSWNPHRNPTHVWTVSACRSCNETFGKMEIALRDQLAICLVPDNPLARAVIAIARANFNPALANKSRGFALAVRPVAK
jgi:hypothetical protein